MGISLGPRVSSEGLTFCIDSRNRDSYSTSGTTWTDLVGGINGTLVGSQGPTFGGNSFLFDGISGLNQHASFGDTNVGINSGTSALTITSWVRVDKSAAGTSGLGDAIVSRTSGTTPFGGWMLNVDSNRRIDFGINIGGTWQSYITKGGASTILTVNVWYHVAGVYDGSTMKVYVNGSLVGSVSQTGTISYVGSLNPLYVGRNASNYFGGSVATVNIFRRALSADEINIEYITTNRNLSLQPASVITSAGLGMLLDASSDPAASDLSGNNRNGTLNGSLSTSGGSPNYWIFDSGAKSISLPAGQFSNNVFTMEAWVYQTSQPTTGIIFASQGSNTAGFWGMGSNSSGYWFGLFDGSSRPSVSSGTSITGAWNLVTATRDASNTATLYLNGVLTAQGTVSGNFASGVPRVGVNPINSGERLVGYLSIMRYYPGTALTYRQVINNFKSQRATFGV